MTTPQHVRGKHTSRIGDSALAERLRSELEGDVLFDNFSRGRYSTDASIYQIEPIGVVIPKSAADVRSTIQIANDQGIPILPRGGGTSQCGQTVGEALVIDVSKHLNSIIDLDVENHSARVEPGLVLDHLNSTLQQHGLWFPVDVSTSSRATLGGMTGNNSCGARSLRYGTMRDNVSAIDGFLADGSAMHFGEVSSNEGITTMSTDQRQLVEKLLNIGRDQKMEIRKKFPDLMRRVGGYNIDALVPDGAPRGAWSEATVNSSSNHPNLAHLLVGSEGTLAYSSQIHLNLQPVPKHKVLGICHFPTFVEAMASTQYIVKLGPAAVELVDRTMINLARDIPVFRSTVDQFVEGEPDALLLVEFSGDDPDEQIRNLQSLVELMADLGFPGGVVEAIDPAFQKAVWEVRKSGLNIMMSMKGDGKPISFIEDCAVRLEDLADYTSRLTDVFHKHDTEGTWYAHASVGCLHVRPVINLKSDLGAKQMRAISEEAFEMVREYKGSHSGEHGDGLVRSEFHEPMFGTAIVNTFKQVKDVFDPSLILNPGKIVDPPKMDDRSLFRFKPGYQIDKHETVFDWSSWGGLGGAVEMCNNNGACRKRNAGVMCPSFRATGDEQHLTRGRANSLRLALSGQLGSDALTSPEMYETMSLCVGCKGCKRECPTGIDMAKMKTEFLYHYHQRHGTRLFDKLIAYLPRYAPIASKFGWLLNLRNTVPGAAKIGEILSDMSAKRDLPHWSKNPFSVNENDKKTKRVDQPEVALWIDTFNTYFEPENARAALRVLTAAGFHVHIVKPKDGGRPVCCGRTFSSSGMIDEARAEAQRLLDAVDDLVKRGIPIVGIEPSYVLMLRDELPGLIPGKQSQRLAKHSYLLEEFLSSESASENFDLKLKALKDKKILVHGHCHQKAFDTMSSVERSLKLIPEINIDIIDSSCCGMAGSFGYDKNNQDVSMTMGELSLFPAVRSADQNVIIVADGTSCRHQISDGTGRGAMHLARVLDLALPDNEKVSRNIS
jgi:FAD/FMN-containing dehydrogenase/Fe-S oxidoreductase